MSVTFHNHACVEVQAAGMSVLTDPWFFGTIFNDSWRLMIETDVDAIDLSQVRFIWISHEHPDHLHFPTLKAIKDKVKDAHVVMLKRDNSNVKQAVEKLGYKFTELEPRTPYTLGEVGITCYPSGHDCAAVFDTPDEVFLNQNDCKLSNAACYEIRRSHPRIDLWGCQFSFAGYAANRDQPELMRQCQQEHVDAYDRYRTMFRAEKELPFASFVEFCRESNGWLNRHRIRPPIVRTPRMRIQWKLDVRYNGDVKLRPDREVTQAEIHECLRVVATPDGVRINLSDRWMVTFYPDERGVSLRELGTHENYDARMPAEDFVFMFTNPWGADTANISATTYVKNFPAWKNFIVALDREYHR